MSRPEFGPRSSRCYGRSWSNNGRGAWSYLDWPDCDFLPNRILSSLWRRASRGTPARWNRAHQRLGAAAGKTELGWPRLRGTNHSYPTHIIALLLRTEISVLDENEEEWDKKWVRILYSLHWCTLLKLLTFRSTRYWFLDISSRCGGFF